MSFANAGDDSLRWSDLRKDGVDGFGGEVVDSLVDSGRVKGEDSRRECASRDGVSVASETRLAIKSRALMICASFLW